jgi:hypothetical protein
MAVGPIIVIKYFIFLSPDGSETRNYEVSFMGLKERPKEVFYARKQLE